MVGEAQDSEAGRCGLKSWPCQLPPVPLGQPSLHPLGPRNWDGDPPCGSREDERHYVSSAGTVPGTAWAPKERTVDTGSVNGGPWKSHSLSPWLLPLPLPHPRTAVSLF